MNQSTPLAGISLIDQSTTARAGAWEKEFETMVSKRKIPRGRVSAFGVAFAVALAFGAIVAGSAQATWKVNGETFSGEETFVSSGSFEMSIPELEAKFNCSETSKGRIYGYFKLEEDVTLSGCKIVGSPGCKVEPISMKLAGSIVNVHSKTPTLTTVETLGCSWYKIVILQDPPLGFPLGYGANATELAVSTSGTTSFGTHPWYFSGASTWELTGANAGVKWGVGLADYSFKFAFGSEGSGNGQFKAPQGITYGASSLWVVDSNNSRVQKFDSEGNYLSQFGKVGSGNGELKEPKDIAIDAAGNVLVVDRGNNRIQKFNSKGEYLSQFGESGSGNGQLSGPNGLAIDASGNIWVTEIGNDRIQEFNSEGKYLRKSGKEGAGNGEFANPQDIAIDQSGNLWVTDSLNFRVQKFDSKGNYLSQFGEYGSGDGQLLATRGIAVDSSEGNIWVADPSNSRIEVFNSAGKYLAKFGGEKGSGEGQFWGASYFSFDANENLWIADSSNNRVQKWTF